jgi:plasmid stability protein
MTTLRQSGLAGAHRRTTGAGIDRPFMRSSVATPGKTVHDTFPPFWQICYHCNHPIYEGEREMANLIVRNLDQRIVDALKQRAARQGRSAEAEHRAILEEVLCGMPQKKSFAEVLASMPNVGQDEDFERLEDGDKDAHVFD